MFYCDWRIKECNKQNSYLENVHNRLPRKKDRKERGRIIGHGLYKKYAIPGNGENILHVVIRDDMDAGAESLKAG